MADSNSNIINPVENMQTIAGVTPAKRREERKRRQERGYAGEEEHNRDTNKEAGSSDNGENSGGATIDYKA